MSTKTNGDLKLTKPTSTDEIRTTMTVDLPVNFDIIDEIVTSNKAKQIKDTNDLNNRIDRIITNSAENISVQEIIDARGDKTSLGARLTSMDETTSKLALDIDDTSNTVSKLNDSVDDTISNITNITEQLSDIALYNKAHCSYTMTVIPNYVLELATDEQSNTNLFDIEDNKVKIKKDGLYLLQVKGFTSLTTLGRGIKLEMYVDGNLYDTGYQDTSIGYNLIINTTLLAAFRINHVVSFKLRHNNDTNVDIQDFNVEFIWLRGID